MPVNRQPSELIGAIRQQAASLQYLKHSQRRTKEAGMSLPGFQEVGKEDFQALTSLDLDIDSVLCDCMRESSSPPFLHTLRISDDLGNYHRSARQQAKMSFESLIDLCREPSLRTLEWVGHSRYHGLSRGLTPLFGDLPRQMQDLLLKLKTRDVVFRVFAAQASDSCFPPYLYGERAPREVLVFDERTFGVKKMGKELTKEDLTSFEYETRQKVALANQDNARPSTRFVALPVVPGAGP